MKGKVRGVNYFSAPRETYFPPFNQKLWPPTDIVFFLTTCDHHYPTGGQVTSVKAAEPTVSILNPATHLDD